MFLEQIILIFFLNHSLLITISFGLKAEVEIKHTNTICLCFYLAQKSNYSLLSLCTVYKQ